jgi:hypothetical protein
VSHHPPVTAFAVRVPQERIPGKPMVTLEGHCGQRTTFVTSSIAVKQQGRVKITTEIDGEEIVYTIFPLPDVTVSGLLSMSIFLEIFGKTTITSSTGCVSIVDFMSKGWFSGEYFTLKGNVKDENGQDWCELKGNWTKEVQYTRENETKVLFNQESQKPYKLIMGDIKDQHETESLKLWGDCSKALQEKDYTTASRLKSEIEEAQREIRKQMKEDGDYFSPKYFEFVVPDDEDMQGTTKKDPQCGGVDDTTGHWEYKDVHPVNVVRD